MDRCRYPSKPCLNARAVKLNGELHRFCEQHRRQANQNQMRWSKRKQTVLRVRRGDGEDGDDEETVMRTDGSDALAPSDVSRGAFQAHHAMHLPPPPMTHGMNMNVHAAGTSLSHLSLTNGHVHGLNASNQPASGLISSFQDHVARGGAIPGTNGVNLVLGGGGVRRELAPAPPPPAPMSGVHVPPSALPPLLPPRAAPTDQPDPTAVHALLMLERAANIVSQPEMSGKDQNDDNNDDDDAHVRRELKRAKSNEWIARPTLSPAGLPAVGSLVTHGMSSTSSVSSAASVVASVASIGRSASWQPPTVQREDQQRESLGQWMQRKQASLPSLSNIARIEKRSFDSMSSSAPTASSAPGGFLHRGPENSGVNAYGSSVPSRSYHVPLHPAPPAKGKSSASATNDPAAESTKHSALV